MCFSYSITLNTAAKVQKIFCGLRFLGWKLANYRVTLIRKHLCLSIFPVSYFPLICNEKCSHEWIVRHTGMVGFKWGPGGVYVGSGWGVRHRPHPPASLLYKGVLSVFYPFRWGVGEKKVKIKRYKDKKIKGMLLRCKTYPFTLQKHRYCKVIGHLLHRGGIHFPNEKSKKISETNKHCLPRQNS